MKSFYCFVIFLVMYLLSGCSNVSSNPVTYGQITLFSKYVSTSQILKAGSDFNKKSNTAVDSIKISKARLILRDIKFKTDIDSASFRSEPIVLELDLTGNYQNITTVNVPYANYRRIEFDIHRAVASDLTGLSAESQAKFTDFLADDKYSILIDGTLYKQGKGQAFTYKSRLNVKQKIDISSGLNLSYDNPYYQAVLIISSFEWFKSSPSNYLDPMDSSNENLIDSNLRDSFFLK
jgi:hypothetical protein